MRQKLNLMFLLVLLWALMGAVGAGAEKTAGNTPKAIFPQAKYDFSEIMEGQEIKHDFVVENRGQGPLKILRVQPD